MNILVNKPGFGHLTKTFLVPKQYLYQKNKVNKCLTSGYLYQVFNLDELVNTCSSSMFFFNTVKFYTVKLF